jgi:hypothetical protein
MGDGFVRTDQYRKKVFLGYWIVFAELWERCANWFLERSRRSELAAATVIDVELVWDGPRGGKREPHNLAGNCNKSERE